METKNKRQICEEVRRKLGLEEVYYEDPEGISQGLALWWKKELKVQVNFKNSNIIDPKISNSNPPRSFEIT